MKYSFLILICNFLFISHSFAGNGAKGDLKPLEPGGDYAFSCRAKLGDGNIFYTKTFEFEKQLPSFHVKLSEWGEPYSYKTMNPTKLDHPTTFADLDPSLKDISFKMDFGPYIGNAEALIWFRFEKNGHETEILAGSSAVGKVVYDTTKTPVEATITPAEEIVTSGTIRSYETKNYTKTFRAFGLDVDCTRTK